ncbi:Metallo-dependent phosphatase-like protein [Aspergillus lucknowensis]|uniref:Metallo-dependent phosphatase-like protein n=1 Tax=Aspergillus lucknowensis TaxID=176173 RepID=A0ABR4LQA6_9EURO
MMRQKTRFVCVSDTHGYTPSEAGFRLPAGDVLIHAGDLTNQGSKSELRKTMGWIAAADYEVKIVVCGNHDITLDEAFYAENKARFHNKIPEDSQECMEVVTGASSSIVFLKHQSAFVRLSKSNGPNTVFKVFGSPYSQCDGNWAFLYESDRAEEIWRQIPSDTDIVVTHMPPHFHCDKISGTSMGCRALNHNLNRVRPLLAVCGHIHESRGYERVRWPTVPLLSGLDEAESLEGEVSKGILPPPGSKKQSLVDLTGKRAPRLDNDGFAVGMDASSLTALFPPSQDFVVLPPQGHRADQATEFSPSYPTEAQDSDVERLSPQRKETCIVNAAIMATNWPHRGGRKFYPGPIVVDLELPGWRENSTFPTST